MNKMRLIILICILFVGICQVAYVQPLYWQFAPKDLLINIQPGMTQQEVISAVVKKKKYLGKYTLAKKRLFIDSGINFVDHELLSGTMKLPSHHKLFEWFDPETMVINYSILFINGVCVRMGLYFIYPNIEMGEIDLNYVNITSFFSQVGWYIFCAHPIWDFDVRCGYQTNYVPMFESYKFEDQQTRMYKYRLKIAKGLCKTNEHALSESIEITISDAEALQKALAMKSIEEAALYGTTLFGFGLDKQLVGCAK